MASVRFSHRARSCSLRSMAPKVSPPTSWVARPPAPLRGLVCRLGAPLSVRCRLSAAVAGARLAMGSTLCSAFASRAYDARSNGRWPFPAQPRAWELGRQRLASRLQARGVGHAPAVRHTPATAASFMVKGPLGSPTERNVQAMVTIGATALSEFVRDIFAKSGCSAAESTRIGKYLVSANLTGHDSHGVARVPRYLQWKGDGVVIADQTVTVLTETPVLAVV